MTSWQLPAADLDALRFLAELIALKVRAGDVIACGFAVARPARIARPGRVVLQGRVELHADIARCAGVTRSTIQQTWHVVARPHPSVGPAGIGRSRSMLAS